MDEYWSKALVIRISKYNFYHEYDILMSTVTKIGFLIKYAENVQDVSDLWSKLTLYCLVRSFEDNKNDLMIT